VAEILFKNSLIIHKPLPNQMVDNTSRAWALYPINLILISMQCFIRYTDTPRDLWILINYHNNLCFSRMLISNVHKTTIVINSLDARFSKNVFEAVQKTRSTCFIGSKTTRLCLVVLNPIKHSCSFFKHYINHWCIYNQWIYRASEKSPW